jgi:4-amino-4-deoxychorismate lyase
MIWHNGKLTEDNIAPGEHGIFETIRVADGKAQSLNLHFERMRRSADALGLNIRWNNPQLTQAFSDIIKVNNSLSCAARLTVTDGITIETFSLRYTAQDYERGYKIGLIEERREDSPDKYIHKTLANREKNFRVKKVVTERGFNEGLWIDGEEEVCEGIFSNIFILEQSGALATPPAFCGLLPDP